MLSVVDVNPQIDRTDSAPDEAALLRDRWSLLGDGIALYRELSVVSVATVDACFDQLDEYVRDRGVHTFVVDLTTAGRPGAEERHQLRRRIAATPGLKHFILVTGKNPLINVAIRFVMGNIANLEIRVFRSVEQALAALGHDRGTH